jgi:hypothetical protein
VDRELEAIRAMITIPEMEISRYSNALEMTTTVAAQLQDTTVRQVADNAIKLIAHRCGVEPHDMVQLLQFLLQDHDTQQRLTAWRTAKRLRGERA